MSEAEAEANAAPGSLAALAKIIGWPQVVTILDQALDEMRAERDALKTDNALLRSELAKALLPPD